MDAAEWKDFLATWTRELAERKSNNPNARRDLNPVTGLGFPGATEAQIAAAEAHLGVRLPPSYREFLKATNGLQQPYSYVPACGGDLWSVQDLDWFNVRNAEWIDAYDGVDEGTAGGGLKFVEELRGTLELSRNGDSAVYLLNPYVKTEEGEWEAWFFASWSPDVDRFRSFDEMMRTRYHQFSAGVSDGF
jgi:cell wall assembly regulator SMI1